MEEKSPAAGTTSIAARTSELVAFRGYDPVAALQSVPKPAFSANLACAVRWRRVCSVSGQSSASRMLKVELHTHTADDPVDRIPHTTFELIDRAAELHYNAIAITLHERRLDVSRFKSYAEDRGIVLIPGVER